MKILENKKTKKLLIINIVIILIAIITMSIFNHIQNKRYREKINTTISLIVDKIKIAYPDVNDEELIKILNDENIDAKRENILNKYGIDNSKLSIKSLEQQEKNKLLYNIGILFITASLLLCTFYLYLKNRKKEIDKLTEYIEQISNKVYDLAIEENSEDELNSLKNELYKITVMLKEEAENSISQKEALAMSVSDISHQLKTPLTSVLILLDNLSQSDNMDKLTREKFISEIARQIEGMNWLVISLLKLSRLDAGVVDFSNTKIDANKLIEDILSNLEIMAELKNVSFKVENIRKEKTYFNGDYNWNKEAIQNIIKNAIEHTKENSKVTIQIEENDVYTSISVIDEGNGISNKDLKHIFDRFYKSENSSENSFGIGLSLSKSIIEKQNGYIEVETDEGKGTTFKVKYIK